MPINELPGVHFIQPGGMIDKIHGLYLFIGYDTTGGHYYSLDINTGNIIYSPVLTTNMSQIRYDEQEQKIYGLCSAKDTGEYFVSVDSKTGNYSRISLLPGIKYIVGGASFYTYDAANHHYLFVGEDPNRNSFLYTINSLNGQILYKASFTMISSFSDNVICLEYDNNLNKLYAIHWESHTIPFPSNESVLVFPNPFKTKTTITFKNPISNIVVSLFSTDGKLISKQSFGTASQITLERNDLPDATYYASICSDNVPIGLIKLVAE